MQEGFCSDRLLFLVAKVLEKYPSENYSISRDKILVAEVTPPDQLRLLHPCSQRRTDQEVCWYDDRSGKNFMTGPWAHGVSSLLEAPPKTQLHDEPHDTDS
jgi:hypothetical protein